MAALTWKDQRRISAQRVLPSRSAAAANTGNNFVAVSMLDVSSTGAARDIRHACNEYVLTIAPGTAAGSPPENIPNPQLGDVCHVFSKDDTDTNTAPRGYAMYIFTGTGALGEGGTKRWRQVTVDQTA